MLRDTAELVAAEALSWLAANDDLLPVFLGSTGASVTEMRNQADSPEFLAAVLDFVLMDDAWIEAFCAARRYSPDFPLRARAALPGGAQINWT